MSEPAGGEAGAAGPDPVPSEAAAPRAPLPETPPAPSPEPEPPRAPLPAEAPRAPLPAEAPRAPLPAIEAPRAPLPAPTAAAPGAPRAPLSPTPAPARVAAPAPAPGAAAAPAPGAVAAPAPGAVAAPAPAAPAGWGLLGWWRRRQAETEARWSSLYTGVRRNWIVTKVVLLHTRYTFGYLAAGFLISAPMQLATDGGLWQGHVIRSLVLGLIAVIPFLVLMPFSQIDWQRMRLPEFKNLELGLTRYASYAALAFLLLANVARVWPEDSTFRWLCDPKVAWINTMLMFFGWVRVKFHAVVFREFYTLKPDEDLVLLPPTGAPLSRSGLLNRRDVPSVVPAPAAPEEPGSAA